MKFDWTSIKNEIFKLKDISIIGISDTVASGISAIFWFFMAAVMGAEQYGELSYFLAIAGLASSIAMVGSENMLMVYPAKNVKIQSTTYFITSISGSIVTIIIFMLFLKIETSVLLVGYVIFGLASHEILGRKLYVTYSRFLISQRILMVVLAVGFYYIMGTDGVILGLGLAYFPYIIRIYKGFKETKIDFSLIRNRIGFIVNSYAMKVVDTLGSSTDRLIIGPMFGFALLGNYQLGYQFIALLDIIPTIVYKFTLPHDASGNENVKLKKGLIFVGIISALSGYFLSPIILPFTFPKYIEAIEIIQIMSLSMIPSSIAYAYTSKLLGAEKTKIVLIGYVVYLIALIIGIITLGEYFGINGAAFAIVISSTSQTVVLVTGEKFGK